MNKTYPSGYISEAHTPTQMLWKTPFGKIADFVSATWYNAITPLLITLLLKRSCEVELSLTLQGIKAGG